MLEFRNIWACSITWSKCVFIWHHIQFMHWPLCQTVSFVWTMYGSLCSLCVEFFVASFPWTFKKTERWREIKRGIDLELLTKISKLIRMAKQPNDYLNQCMFVMFILNVHEGTGNQLLAWMIVFQSLCDQYETRWIYIIFIIDTSTKIKISYIVL